jgi:hypothetical protein
MPEALPSLWYVARNLAWATLAIFLLKPVDATATSSIGTQLYLSVSALGKSVVAQSGKDATLKLDIPHGGRIGVEVSANVSDRDLRLLDLSDLSAGSVVFPSPAETVYWYINQKQVPDIGRTLTVSLPVDGAQSFKIEARVESRHATSSPYVSPGLESFSYRTVAIEIEFAVRTDWACRGRVGMACADVAGLDSGFPASQLRSRTSWDDVNRQFVVEAQMSVGAILHDACCDRHPNGYFCWGPDKSSSECKSEWNLALSYEAIIEPFAKIGIAPYWDFVWKYPAEDERDDIIKRVSLGKDGWWKHLAPDGAVVSLGEDRPSADSSVICESGGVIRKQTDFFLSQATGVLRAIDPEMRKTDVWLCGGAEEAIFPDGATEVRRGDGFAAIIATVIDVSGSMNDTVTVVDHGNVTTRRTKLNVAKDATVSLSVIASHANAATSLSTFSQYGATIVPMGSGPEHQDSFREGISGLTATGGTNIGGGLERGFEQLSSGGNRCAVLMSDGQNNVGSFDKPLEHFIKTGIPIYTVGFGEEAGRDELSKIAIVTKGTFEPAVSKTLPQKFLKVANNCTHTSTITEVTEHLLPGAQLEYDILVLDTVSRIGGYATWQGSTLDLVLIDPRGRQIPSAALAAHGSEFAAGPNFFVYSLAQPEPGRWRARFFWSDPPTVPEQINIAFSEQSDVVMSLVGIENEYAVGAPVQIVLRTGEVVGQERVPLQDPQMRVRVQKPGSQVMDVVRARSRNLQLLERVVDAATVTLEVHDDGQHGDYHPGDGIFGGVFTDTHEPGVYLVKAEVRGRKSDGSWVQREITATFQVGPLADNPVTAAEVLAIVDLLSQRQDPLRAIEAVRSGQIRTAPAPVTRPATVPQGIPQIRPAQPPVQGEPILPTQPRPSAGGPAAAIERLRARE